MQAPAALAALTFALLGCTSSFPVRAEPVEAPSSSAALTAKVDALAARANLAGEILIAKGDTILLDEGYGPIAPIGGAPHKAGETWRLASITKQVVAALIVRDLERQSFSLDAPVAGLYGQTGLGALSMRQLLTHHTGLANPDDTPAEAGGMPTYYQHSRPDMGYCFSKAPTPGAPFAYNNCDYIVAALGLIGGNAKRYPWPAGMRMARPGEKGISGFVGGKAEPRFELDGFSFAGGLIGTARAVFAFDRQLMTGKFLTSSALAELWKPEGNGSYQALGQWVFPGALKGCAAPKRIVQRDGEIGGVQTRNFILPDDDLVVIVFSNRSSDDFAFGEVWQQSGFAYDLLSAAACP